VNQPDDWFRVIDLKTLPKLEFRSHFEQVVDLYGFVSVEADGYLMPERWWERQ